MPAYKARIEVQEVPFGAGGFEYVKSIDAQFIENDRQLIDQRNIDVSLGILDNFSRFGHFDAGCTVHACRHHEFIGLGNLV